MVSSYIDDEIEEEEAEVEEVEEKQVDIETAQQKLQEAVDTLMEWELQIQNDLNARVWDAYYNLTIENSRTVDAYRFAQRKGEVFNKINDKYFSRYRDLTRVERIIRTHLPEDVSNYVLLNATNHLLHLILQLTHLNPALYIHSTELTEAFEMVERSANRLIKERYSAFLKDLIKAAKMLNIEFPESRNATWDRYKDKGQNLYWAWDNVAKGFHDLAIVLSNILTRWQNYGGYESIAQRIRKRVRGGGLVEIYFAPPFLNIQAASGHSVKFDLEKGVVYGHIGDVHLIADIRASIDNWESLSADEMVEKGSAVTNVIADMIETEQIYRRLQDVNYRVIFARWSNTILNRNIEALIQDKDALKAFVQSIERPGRLIEDCSALLKGHNLIQQCEQEIEKLKSLVSISFVRTEENIESLVRLIQLLSEQYGANNVVTLLNNFSNALEEVLYG